jgi:hypothetical protein
MRAAVKSLLLVLAVGFAVAASQAAPAVAAKPCSQAVVDDWWDGHIDRTYPKHCYTDAINNLHSDLQGYSNAADEIRAAMYAALSQKKGKGGGNGPPASGPQARGYNPPSAHVAAPTKDPSKKGIIGMALEWLGPSDAASIPLPLLILAGVAFLLLAAAGGSLINRRLQERRLPPPPRA